MEKRESHVRYGIGPGAIYLIEMDGIPKEHYFVVLNYEPKTDERIILVNATTNYAKEYRQVRGGSVDVGTMVTIEAGDSKHIRRGSTFNCNMSRVVTVSELCYSINIKRLEYVGQLEKSILAELREATLLSPRLKRKDRKFLELPSDP